MKTIYILNKRDYQIKNIITQNYNLFETNEEYKFKTAKLTLYLKNNSPILMGEIIHIDKNTDGNFMYYIISSMTTDEQNNIQELDLIEFGSFIQFVAFEVHKFQEQPASPNVPGLFLTTPYRLNKTFAPDAQGNAPNQLINNFSVLGINLTINPNQQEIPLDNGFISLSVLLESIKNTTNFRLTFTYPSLYEMQQSPHVINANLKDIDWINEHMLTIYDVLSLSNTKTILDYYDYAYPIFNDDMNWGSYSDYNSFGWRKVNTNNGIARNVVFDANNINWYESNHVPLDNLEYVKYLGEYYIQRKGHDDTNDVKTGVSKALGINVTLNSSKSAGRYILCYWDLVINLQKHNNKAVRDHLRNTSVKKDYKLYDVVFVQDGYRNIRYYVSKTVKNLNTGEVEVFLQEF